MVDSTFNNPKDPMEFNTDVQALLLFCPAFALLERDQTPDVNVFNNLDKPFPPVLFLVGETDNWKKASDVLAKDLKSRGVDVENVMAQDKGHMFFRKEPWLTVCLQKLDSFLVAKGLLTGSSKLKAPASGEQLIPVK